MTQPAADLLWNPCVLCGRAGHVFSSSQVFLVGCLAVFACFVKAIGFLVFEELRPKFQAIAEELGGLEGSPSNVESLSHRSHIGVTCMAILRADSTNHVPPANLIRKVGCDGWLLWKP